MNRLRAGRFRVPSAVARVEEIIEDLAQHRSVLVLARDAAEADDLWAVVQGELERRSSWLELVDAGEADDPAGAGGPGPGGSPHLGLARALCVEWRDPGAPRTLEHLLRCDIPEIIAVRGMGALPPPRLGEWMQLLRRWAEVAQGMPGLERRVPALCVVAEAERLWEVVPETNVRLAVHWLWETPSALETRLLCRGRCEGSLEERWREFVLPAVACDDLRLAAALWNAVGTPREAWDALQRHGQARGWTGAILGSLGVGGLRPQGPNGRTSAPPRDLRRLWARGLLHSTPEYGIELHSAALAVLGHEEAIDHRLWRGQAGLLLPMLDGLRLEMCAELTQVHGRDWPVRWKRPLAADQDEAVVRTPLACEWGHLETLVREFPGPFRKLTSRLGFIGRCRTVRNDLAHYRPVTRAAYESIATGTG